IFQQICPGVRLQNPNWQKQAIWTNCSIALSIGFQNTHYLNGANGTRLEVRRRLKEDDQTFWLVSFRISIGRHTARNSTASGLSVLMKTMKSLLKHKLHIGFIAIHYWSI